MSGHLRTPWEVLRDPDLDPLAKIVCQVVLSHVGSKGYQMKRRTIATEANVSTTTVRRVLPILVERGLLVIEQRFEKGERKPDFFRAGPAWGASSQEGGGSSEETPVVPDRKHGGSSETTREVVTPEVVTSEVVPPPTPSEPVPESVGRPPGEEEQQTASRAVMTEGVSSPRAIPDALATQRGFTSGEQAARFLAEMWPDVRKPVAFLRGLRTEGRERWLAQVEEWQAEEQATYRDEFDHWRHVAQGLTVDGERHPRRLQGCYSDEREQTLAMFVALRQHWSAHELVDRVLAEPVPRDDEPLVSITLWLADLLASGEVPVAQPATTSPPWPPEPWDIAADNGGYTWREQCAPLAEGEF